MPEHVRADIVPDDKKAKVDIQKLDGKLILIIDLEKWEIVPGGLVRNEEKALATPCHGYDLGEGKKILSELTDVCNMLLTLEGSSVFKQRDKINLKSI